MQSVSFRPQEPRLRAPRRGRGSCRAEVQTAEVCGLARAEGIQPRAQAEQRSSSLTVLRSELLQLSKGKRGL